jgi:putative aminopeptidase FrvX
VDLAFPVRYAHAPIEVCQRTDLERLIVLLTAALEGIDAGLDLSRG